jgi:hypothetical protein
MRQIETGVDPSRSSAVQVYVRGAFEKFVDWRQCAALMKKEAVVVIPSCSGGGNVVVE